MNSKMLLGDGRTRKESDVCSIGCQPIFRECYFTFLRTVASGQEGEPCRRGWSQNIHSSSWKVTFPK